MNKKYYIIYKITCLINNKIYIGQHATDDISVQIRGGANKTDSNEGRNSVNI